MKKKFLFTLIATIAPMALFSCNQTSPFDNNDYIVSTKFIGCRILNLQESYHYADVVSGVIEAENDFKLPEVIGQVEVLDYDGNIVQCHYSRRDDKNADISFKMPASDVTISCNAISTKKYHVDFDFGSDYKFVDGYTPDPEGYLPGTSVTFRMIPCSFENGVAVPEKSQVSLPFGFSYKPCEDRFGAVITGTVPNEDISYKYTGTTKPNISLGFSWSGVEDPYDTNGAWAQNVWYNKGTKSSPSWVSMDITTNFMTKVSTHTFSSRFGQLCQFKLDVIFSSDTLINLPAPGNVVTEQWEKELGVPDHENSIVVNSANGKRRTFIVSWYAFGSATQYLMAQK